ncbi:hypothetical protein COM90_07960 [Bacillus thuringiensis]|uniref:Lipoprotein n=1 Tax=Bacillus thuringiensis TaxID=1428 RepID=A0AB36TX11_BACTU|nr:hypothetical protein COM74_29570 [Bacillus thuringiensis]PEE89317.1 hypothetical protein COM90_07960 [Bacillus thuringiensis]PFM93065.1 hypothetical protein COJ61_12400 [Bacillus thuringiensis]
MNKLLLSCLLTTFCLNIAGCSNDMTILKDSSKPSTPTKAKCINKAWYKKIYPVLGYIKVHEAKSSYVNHNIKIS